ncbi:hypothetical protein L226DRAFT_379118 [Lentinus tigrinus ALCF2SS1-7]|uniref:Uncharacterized protein n=1 Tax=Lentinus tigrinus ALCF2SS1-6 TaxID=1328759 RepID=A0A5C2SM02_9APHY|nr:hypothetical protein L227DRAFT_325151 [Lentinus tigrinus ALCF2SS1-6]RPD76526.1 hypothetical protein L226DRAFT_379118 [Lentinus tigrinus ALCF2SS1-7]
MVCIRVRAAVSSAHRDVPEHSTDGRTDGTEWLPSSEEPLPPQLELSFQCDSGLPRFNDIQCRRTAQSWLQWLESGHQHVRRCSHGTPTHAVRRTSVSPHMIANVHCGQDPPLRAPVVKISHLRPPFRALYPSPTLPAASDNGTGPSNSDGRLGGKLPCRSHRQSPHHPHPRCPSSVGQSFKFTASHVGYASVSDQLAALLDCRW